MGLSLFSFFQPISYNIHDSPNEDARSIQHPHNIHHVHPNSKRLASFNQHLSTVNHRFHEISTTSTKLTFQLIPTGFSPQCFQTELHDPRGLFFRKQLGKCPQAIVLHEDCAACLS